MYSLNPATQKLRVVQLNFVSAGTHNPMHFRPYMTDMNDNSMRAIASATAGGQNVSANALAPVAGMFMRPVAEAGSAIQIPNGWGTERFRFIMQLEYPEMAGGRVVQYVTGYTNKADLSYNGLLDPAMMLYFNNSMLMQDIVEQTPVGPIRRMKMVSADQVLGAEALGIGAYMSGAQSPIRSMRPEDVFSVLGTDRYRGGGGAEDLRPAFLPSDPLKKSSRQNNSISSYLARSIDRSAMAASEADWDTSSAEQANNTSAKLAENTIYHDNFLSWIQARSLMTSGGAVPWGELCAAAPEADYVAKVVGGQGPVLINNPMAGSTEYWTSTTNETIFASILAQTVPSLMMDNLIGKLSVRCNNRHAEMFGRNGEGVGTRHSVLLTEGYLLNQEKISQPLFLHLVSTFAQQILPEASMAGMIDYEFHGTFDLLGTSFISISLGGGPFCDYTVPTFADALFTPAVTGDPLALTMMASDIGRMVGSMQEIAQPAPATSPIGSRYGF